MSRPHWVRSHVRLGCNQITLVQEITWLAGVLAGHIGSDHMQSLGGSRSHWVRRSREAGVCKNGECVWSFAFLHCSIHF